MGDQLFQVEVNNVPQTVNKYVVARFDEHTNALWFYGYVFCLDFIVP